MIGSALGHLGPKTSALLDGQLSPADEERAWQHVHLCHVCRDQVEREGWVKTRLAGLSGEPVGASDDLKWSLRAPAITPGDALLAQRSRRSAGLAAIGGGAVGAAVMGVLALGVAPADSPTIDRRAPTTSLNNPVFGPRVPAASVTPASFDVRRTLAP